MIDEYQLIIIIIKILQLAQCGLLNLNVRYYNQYTCNCYNIINILYVYMYIQCPDPKPKGCVMGIIRTRTNPNII